VLVSPTMIAQAPNNSWSELLTSAIAVKNVFRSSVGLWAILHSIAARGLSWLTCRRSEMRAWVNLWRLVGSAIVFAKG